MFGILPNKYRVYSEQIADKDMRDNGARLGLRYGKSGDRYEKCWRGDGEMYEKSITCVL